MKIKSRRPRFQIFFLLTGLACCALPGFAGKRQLPAKLAADSGYYRSFDNSRIYYEVHGSGQPVLLLHGFMGSSASWKHTVLYDELLAQGYRVILIDLRGNGKSDHPHHEEAYAQDAESRDVSGLLDFLQIKSYDLIGYSRGSIIAARVLHNDPRVHKAVIGGMGAAFTDTAWRLPRSLYESLIHAPSPDFAAMKKYVREQQLDSVALAYMQKQQPFTSVAELKKIKQPVLLIRGDRDSTNGSAAELQRLIPRSVYMNVPGDHNGSAATKIFADRVIGFLKS